jgi:hypothetical protein
LMVVPNPDPRELWLKLEGGADGGEAQVWTVAMRQALSFNFGAVGRGWVEVPLPSGSLRELANGVYYVRVRLSRGPAQVYSRPVTLVIAR